MSSAISDSSYARYKQDTYRVATYLAYKAKNCGYTKTILNHSTEVPLHKGRLKGKARQAAGSDAQQHKSQVTVSTMTISAQAGYS